jgi:hypothetical protein
MYCSLGQLWETGQTGKSHGHVLQRLPCMLAPALRKSNSSIRAYGAAKLRFLLYLERLGLARLPSRHFQDESTPESRLEDALAVTTRLFLNSRWLATACGVGDIGNALQTFIVQSVRQFTQRSDTHLATCHRPLITSTTRRVHTMMG